MTRTCSCAYRRRIIELMGGAGAGDLDDAARELYDDWALDQHFSAV